MGLDHWQVTPTCRVRLHPPHLTELPASTRCLSSARVSPDEDCSPFPMALEAQSRALSRPRPCPAPLVLPLLFQASGSSHTHSPLKCLPFPLHPAKSCAASFKSPLRCHLLRAALCGFSCTSLTCCPRIPASSTDLLDSFLLSRRSCQISAFSRNPKLCGTQDSASPPHATVALPQAVIQIMESLTLQ